MNLEIFWGIGGAYIVRELVAMTKTIWEEKSYSGLLNILSSVVYGVALSLSLAGVLGKGLDEGLFYGVVVGILAPVWNTVINVSKS